jgi:hypothetical protein
MTRTKEQDRPSLSLVSQNGRHVKGKPRLTRPVTEEEATVELIEKVQELHDRLEAVSALRVDLATLAARLELRRACGG